MKRREFVAGLGWAVAWPVVAQAQQGERMRRIGVLFVPGDENDPENKRQLSEFTQGLAGLGWAEGHNVRIDRVWGDDINQLPALAHELIGLHPDIVLAGATPATLALQRETQTIPIVFVNVSDPLSSGIVAALNRPGGNTTGFAYYETTLAGKWLELLSEIAPGLKRAAIMFNPDTAPASAHLPSFETAARSLNVVPSTARVHSDLEIETAIIALGREPGGSLVVMPDVFTYAHRTPIILAAARNNVPAVYPFSFFAREGGLLSYGVDNLDGSRRAATYVDRILRGAKPADLPVQRATKIEFAINLKTAKALGLIIPPNLLAIADEVIE
jgi:putative tryptophan/tyrosine transport system substrate-binding protein